MQSIFNKRFKAIIIFILMMNASYAIAQSPSSSSSGNLLAGLMITLSVILAFVIWGMGSVLIALSRESLKKKSSGNLPVVFALGLSLFALSANAQDTAPVEVVSSFNYGGLSATLFWVMSIVLFLEVLCILFLLLMIKRMQQSLEPETAHSKESSFKEWWERFDKKYFTKAVSVEKEADIMMDHEYDGIRELDNSLPPWWKYGFIITIIGSVIYMFYFHVGSGKDPLQEYEFEIEKAAVALAKYNASNVNKIDENNLTLADAAGIEKGQALYNAACWACHGKQLEGGTGPNLTDDYWIHKGGLTDIYLSIKHGYPDKGMQSWEKVYSANEILYLSSYIKSLSGSNPPGSKAPQGDLWVEAETTVADTTAL